MLKNVGHPGGVLGHRALGNQEHVFAVVCCQVIVHGASGGVLELLHPYIEGIDRLLAQRGERRVGAGKGGTFVAHEELGVERKGPILG